MSGFSGPPIDLTAWTAYTPSITCGGGTTAGCTPSGFYKTIGKTTFIRISMTTTTTTATSVVLGLPNTSQGGVTIIGRESATNGSMLMLGSATSGTTAAIWGTIGTGSAAINNATYTFVGCYESA